MHVSLGAYIPAIPVPVRLPYGGWWLARNDFVGIALFHGGIREYRALFCREFSRPGMTVLDIGAHHGYYTLLASRKVGHREEYWPSKHRREKEKGCATFESIGCKNVQIDSRALGEAEGTAELYLVHGSQTGCNSLRQAHLAKPTERCRSRSNDWIACFETIKSQSGLHKAGRRRGGALGLEGRIGASAIAHARRFSLKCRTSVLNPGDIPRAKSSNILLSPATTGSIRFPMAESRNGIDAQSELSTMEILSRFRKSGSASLGVSISAARCNDGSLEDEIVMAIWNVLVTGSSGLIGSEAVEYFDRQGHRLSA